MPETDPPPPRFLERSRAALARLRIPQRWEHWHPAMLGLAAAIAAALAHLPRTSVDAIIREVLPTALGVAAILAGFLTTAESLLLSMIHSPVVQAIRATGHYDRLVGFFREVGRSTFSFIIIALAAMTLKACAVTVGAHDRVIPSAIAGSLVWSLLAAVRMNRLLIKLLRHKDIGGRAS